MPTLLSCCTYGRARGNAGPSSCCAASYRRPPRRRALLRAAADRHQGNRDRTPRNDGIRPGSGRPGRERHHLPPRSPHRRRTPRSRLSDDTIAGGNRSGLSLPHRARVLAAACGLQQECRESQAARPRLPGVDGRRKGHFVAPDSVPSLSRVPRELSPNSLTPGEELAHRSGVISTPASVSARRVRLQAGTPPVDRGIPAKRGFSYPNKMLGISGEAP